MTRDVMGTLLLLLLCSGLSGVISICYFPAAYQGEFVSQAVLPSQDSLTTPEISYSTISVLYLVSGSAPTMS